MPILIGRGHDVLENVFIAGNIGSGHRLLNHDGTHSFRVEERSRALESLHCDFSVCWVRKVVRVDEREVTHRAGCYVDIAARERRHGDSDDGSEALAGITSSE
jgi:hypothetical protein